MGSSLAQAVSIGVGEANRYAEQADHLDRKSALNLGKTVIDSADLGGVFD